ncbi:extracellular solute-binding protein [Arthrobacter zhangbolii]|uniref:Extracellular solute-binding protein n=1 Tax=Arthrobacter zhangbolii TaxID=2886936 RepID=A0A9X1S8V9_9MICC|nr:extracellular solute-binding protein [Arthrobacter zhangbolii]MCC3272428.1 extracellular solute-binding protein [Arthrobacter zhangbolii]MCC3294090.1 extracellular solute-binding protein [Arthrobacter zhangbolii]UON91714.1 extracellular solute-binding protein [Arthrobacter zhangbolii]
MPKDARHWGRSRKGARSAVGVALALGATLLTGCGSDEGAAPTLTWYINPDAGGQAELAKQCSDASNGAYTIETSLLPNDAASQREQLARRLAAGDKSMDIMSLDPPNVPEYAEPGYLAPVPDDVAERTTQGVLEGALAGAKWKDEVVAVPFWANTQILWYRKSVAEAAGLDMSKPVTWDQIIEAAKSQDKYIGVQGARAESMTVWVNALVASAGGTIVENPDASADEIQLGLDSDAGKQAAEVVSTIGKEGLGGPGLPTQTENTSMVQFQGDQGSFMVNYPFVWPATNASVEEGALPESLIDDIGWTLFPAMNEGEDTAPPLGGINLGVGSNSQHPDLAYEAIECIVSPENQAQYFETNGNPPSNEAAYETPGIEETFPMAPTIRDSLELAVPRPQTPYYNEISTGIQQTWTPPSDVNPDTTPATSQEFITEVLRGEKLL